MLSLAAADHDNAPVAPRPSRGPTRCIAFGPWACRVDSRPRKGTEGAQDSGVAAEFYFVSFFDSERLIEDFLE